MKRSLLILCLVFFMGGLAGWGLSRMSQSPTPAMTSTPTPSTPAVAMNAPAPAPSPPAAVQGAPVLLSAPQKNAKGAYPLLVASILARDVTEFKPADVRKWGDVTEVLVDGARQWCVELEYRTKTKFGHFDVTASAYVKDGKVAKWIYTGSGERIP
jgi:hypothetical protein